MRGMGENRWRRGQRRETESGIDDWLMTYADMITLLLCFFAVFLAIAIPDQRKFETAREKVSEQFRSGDSDFLKGTYTLPPAKDDSPLSSPEPFKALPSIVDRFDGKVPPVEVQKGDRITTVEMNSGAFFERGAATLSDDGIAILKDLIPSLQSPNYKDYMVSVEGYTDDIPIKTAQFPSNWELSTARASAVVRGLIDLGFPPDRLRAVGFGDTEPKVPNRDASGTAIPDNQAQNRRVVIRLEKIVKQK